MNKKIVMIAISLFLAAIAVIVIYKAISSAGISSKSMQMVDIGAKEEAVLFGTAQKLLAEGSLLKARDIYKKIIEKFPSSNNIQKAQESLEGVNIQLLFSQINTPDSFIYEVQKGDNLTRISKQFAVSTELLARSNNIKDGILRVGAKLKIPKAKFSIVVDKAQNILTLKAGGEVVKTYKVSTGKNSSTPVGTFKITNKIVDPPWYPSGGGMIPAGDPKNVLGSRWLGISNPGYGIHGTTQPESIGKSVTEGCIRMKNPEVEELYAIVPVGTEVVIVD